VNNLLKLYNFGKNRSSIIVEIKLKTN